MITILKSEEFNAARPARGSASAPVKDAVAKIVADVADRGDAALREYTEKFDGCTLDAFEVTAAEINAAVDAALTGAKAKNIKAVRSLLEDRPRLRGEQ